MIYSKEWTLFLDRDGVINKELRDDYVKYWEDFIFEDGALEAIAKLSGIFGRIIIVTNQRGIGIELMTDEDLSNIHEKMVAAIQETGGRIDAIYYAPAADRSDIRRKPNPTMAYEAQKDFPEIDLAKSIIVGNSISDMEFGRNAGMRTIFIDEKKKYGGEKTSIMDEISNSLNNWTDSL
ncbi:MAG: D-glycero-alpha-D-manno-heptose-1,7-bisphosphate 7-phosphatase [Bacteroidota bacterium]